jgi:hypothetical protein
VLLLLLISGSLYKKYEPGGGAYEGTVIRDKKQSKSKVLHVRRLDSNEREGINVFREPS